MPDYVILYHGGATAVTPEQGAAQRAKWRDWIGSLGDAVVNPGTPLGAGKRVTASLVADTVGPETITGFSIVRVDSMDAAIDIARRCPYLELGELEVRQIMEMR
jgi:hypothetical protein